MEHDLIGKPVSTLGSSPRACFSGSCSVRKEEKGKRNADQRGSVSTALACGARFAKRARQSAFHHGSDLRDYSSQRLTSGQASCHTGQTRRDPRQPVRHFQRCTSRAGRNAGGLMPETPGSGGDEPPRAGTASRSNNRSDRLMSCTANGIKRHLAGPRIKVTSSLRDRDYERPKPVTEKRGGLYLWLTQKGNSDAVLNPSQMP